MPRSVSSSGEMRLAVDLTTERGRLLLIQVQHGTDLRGMGITMSISSLIIPVLPGVPLLSHG